VLTALLTCLTKKIENPEQDIRLHREEFEGGFSARGYDTLYITPFLKDKFPEVAMKESGWLTRSIEQPHPFTLDFPGKIRNKEIKDAFLQILNEVEENKANSAIYLTTILLLLKKYQFRQERLLEAGVPIGETVLISSILEELISLFASSGASKLPVIAIYSIYEVLRREVERYRNKNLKPLRSHYSPDIRAGEIGDIEVVDEKEEYFEIVEIKHNKPIGVTDIKDAYNKFKGKPVSRYYLLTTAEPYLGEPEEKIEEQVKKIREEHGCEVIINGIIPSLRYYLRLVKEPLQFIETFTNNLKLEFAIGEIRENHLKSWGATLRDLQASYFAENE
jgi:DNA (cytosine-5)-methyltransferase 1